MWQKARSVAAVLTAVALVLLVAACGRAEEDGSAGASAGGGEDLRTIKVGGSFPMSGQLAGLSAAVPGMRAYFGKVNDEGGVDGRRIEFIALDDGYEPARTLQNVQRLEQQDRVFTLFGTLGTPTNLATLDWVRQRRIPDLFLYTGALVFGEDTERHPYTMPGLPDYLLEGRTYGEFLKQERPDATIAVMYQNDDYGKSLLEGLEASVEGSGLRIVASESYEATDASVDPKVTKLSRSGADAFMNFASPKFAAQAIKRIGELDWRPMQFVNSVSNSKTSVLEPAGLANSRGIYSVQYFKDPETPQWDDDEDMREYREAMAAHGGGAPAEDPLSVQGWLQAAMLVAALDGMREVSREALIESAHALDTHLPMLLPEINARTGPDDAFPIESLQVQRFDGDVWQLEGELIRNER